jgi:hypothetical protein
VTVLFVCPALSPYRLDFSLLFQNNRFVIVQNGFKWIGVVVKIGVPGVEGDMSLFGGLLVGYSSLYMWVLCRISGTALNLVVMQRLISHYYIYCGASSTDGRAYTGGSHYAPSCIICGAYPFTLISDGFTVRWI